MTPETPQLVGFPWQPLPTACQEKQGFPPMPPSRHKRAQEGWSSVQGWQQPLTARSPAPALPGQAWCDPRLTHPCQILLQLIGPGPLDGDTTEHRPHLAPSLPDQDHPLCLSPGALPSRIHTARFRASRPENFNLASFSFALPSPKLPQACEGAGRMGHCPAAQGGHARLD